jgi:hypothetical protein
MSYIVRAIVTKPTDVEWYYQYDPLINSEANAWREAQTILISYTGSFLDAPTNCVFEEIYTFASEADYNTYVITGGNNSSIAARRAYNAENNILVTSTVVTNT